jgi:hypothetical protein
VEDFKSNLNNFVNAKGLEDFYPDGNEYVAKVAEKAVKILNDPTFPGATPKNVTIMSHQALYQPILYCGKLESSTPIRTPSLHSFPLDDSGSMKDDDRMNRQAFMVERMAKLITDAAPDEGALVHLRFINKNDKFDNLKPSELSSKMKFTPDGSTKLGTNLKDKVLNDFLYQPVKKGLDLSRPLLILTVTDGCPNEEPTKSYENEVRESLKFVKDNGYGEEGTHLSWFYIDEIANPVQPSGMTLARWATRLRLLNSWKAGR